MSARRRLSPAPRVFTLLALLSLAGCRPEPIDTNPPNPSTDTNPPTDPNASKLPEGSVATSSSVTSIMALYGLTNTEETIAVTNNTRRADPSTFLGQVRFLYARNGDCSDTKAGNLIRDRRPEQLAGFDITSNLTSQIWDSIVINQTTTLKVAYLSALSLDFGNSYKYSMTRMSTAAHVVTPDAKWNAAIAKYKVDNKVELWDDERYCAVWYVTGVSVEQAVVKKVVSVDAGGRGSYMVNIDGKAHFGTEQNSVKEVYLLEIAPAKLPADVAVDGGADRSKRPLDEYMRWINATAEVAPAS